MRCLRLVLAMSAVFVALLTLGSAAQAALLIDEQHVHASYDTTVPIGAQPSIAISGTATANLDLYVDTIGAADRCDGEWPSRYDVDRTFFIQPGDINLTYVAPTQTALGPIRVCVWVRDQRDKSYSFPSNNEPLIDTTDLCTAAHGQLALADGRVRQAKMKVLKSHGRTRVRARKLVNRRVDEATAAARAIADSCAGHGDFDVT